MTFGQHGNEGGSDPITEIDILWITAGLGCDGDTIAMTAATQPSITRSQAFSNQEYDSSRCTAKRRYGKQRTQDRVNFQSLPHRRNDGCEASIGPDWRRYETRKACVSVINFVQWPGRVTG